MPRPGGPRVQEKSKDFFGSMKRLLINLKPWKVLMTLALILAMISAILALVAPHKLSDFADEIGAGLVPKTEKFEVISKKMMASFADDKLAGKMNGIFISTDLSDEDKTAFKNGLQKIQQKSEDNMLSMFLSLPESVLRLFLEDIEIENDIISVEKQIEIIHNLAETREETSVELENTSKVIFAYYDKSKIEVKKNVIITSTEISEEDKTAFKNSMQKMEETNGEEIAAIFLAMPESILSGLLEDIVVDDVTITVQDQIDMTKLVAEMGDETGTENALKIMDELPKSVYSVIEPEMNLKRIRNIAIFVGVLYIVSALFSYIQSLSMTHVSNNFAKKLRTGVSSKINTLPLKYFDTHETGDILSRITNDIDTIAQNLNNSLSTLVSSVTLFLGSIFMMFYTNWVMAITAIVASMIGFMFMFGILGKSQKYFNENQRALGELNGYIEENYSGHNVVKAYNGVRDALNDFEKLNNALYEAKRKSIFLSGTMQPLMGFIGNLGYVAVCIVGALLAMNGHISFGVIVAFMIYVRLFTNPLSQIAQAMTNLQSTAAASERVFEFLDEKEMKDQKDIVKRLDRSKVKGNISFEHVKFGYDKNRMIIKDFSVDVKPGQKIAIVGPTGAGKTTMVNLLMKFYEINDGDILIDGVSTKELSRENIHELFCMVLQDTWLFEGTIGDNLRFNKKNVSDEEIMEACKIVGIDHFVKTLPGGLNAVIGDTDTVSQGQKQLFTIARGMLEDAPFLILDEATSNVDTRTEELVQKAMDKLTEGRTSFIIAHRLSTIKNADLILVMDQGNIIEQGNHDQLMKKDGFYAKLYNSQFDKLS